MTERQAKILAAIVETYAGSAEPVGSLALADAFDVSPATVRTEMAGLERGGYIAQPHTSAGRIPTDAGYRYYVNNLQAAPADARISQAIARRVRSAGQVEQSVKTAVDSLVDLTRNLSWATLPDSLYLRGMANLFSQPEMQDARQAFEVARLIDSLGDWIEEAAPDDARVTVFIGRENPIGKASGCSLILAKFVSPYSDEAYIGMIGPTRQNYQRVLGLIDYTSRMLEEQLA